jgi:2'-5' RNA ligase
VVEDLSRVFLAVPIPSDTTAILAALVAGAGPIPGKPAPPRNWHLTLRFLGAVDEVRYDRLLASIDQADLGWSFRIGFDHLGAFPNPRRATVLWLGVGPGSAALGELARTVEDAVQSAGFPPEDRPFHAHLTLSRIRPDRDVSHLVDSVHIPSVSFRATEVVLFRSELGGGPARYTPLESFALRARS